MNQLQIKGSQLSLAQLLLLKSQSITAIELFREFFVGVVECNFHFLSGGFHLYSARAYLHNNQAPVVQTMDSAVHRINHYPADKQ